MGERCLLNCLASVSHTVDETLPLAALGITSSHWGKLANDLGVPVHAIAAAESFAELRSLSSADIRGSERARQDVSTLLQAARPCSRSVLPFSTWRKVLVTGASGHIGSHFAAFLETRGLHVIRASRSQGIDVAKPCFGLTQSTYDCLAEECDAVVHCAAIVNWSASYAALKASNLES